MDQSVRSMGSVRRLMRCKKMVWLKTCICARTLSKWNVTFIFSARIPFWGTSDFHLTIWRTTSQDRTNWFMSCSGEVNAREYLTMWGSGNVCSRIAQHRASSCMALPIIWRMRFMLPSCFLRTCSFVNFYFITPAIFFSSFWHSLLSGSFLCDGVSLPRRLSRHPFHEQVPQSHPFAALTRRATKILS